MSVPHTPACPLCGGSDALSADPPDPNLYSEKLAALVGCDEARLLARLANVRCSDCGLVYKREWFDDATLRALFEDRVPIHPRGWDSGSERFSKAAFVRECDSFASAIAALDATGIARHRRGLRSIVDAIAALDNSPLKAQLRAAIETDDAAALSRLAAALPEDFGMPRAYSRFAGLASAELWDWIGERAGPIARYGEVGCPRFGMLGYAANRGASAIHFARDEPNYWREGCRERGVHCVAATVDQRSIASFDWRARSAARVDVLGALQYFDHVADPLMLLSECFDTAPNLLLIQDGVDGPVAIQHRSGFNDASIAWIGRYFDKRVHADFEPIRASGNRAWLLADA